MATTNKPDSILEVVSRLTADAEFIGLQRDKSMRDLGEIVRRELLIPTCTKYGIGFVAFHGECKFIGRSGEEYILWDGKELNALPKPQRAHLTAILTLLAVESLGEYVRSVPDVY